MSRLESSLRAVSRILDRAERRWALVGALAVSARTEPRFTRDVDVAVAVADDRDAEAVVQLFRAEGYDVFALVEQEARGRLATARLSPAPEAASAGIVVDLLFASSGIETEIAAASEKLEVMPGVIVPVASAGHLLALKVLSRAESRPQDAADIESLRRVASGADRNSAREAARAIAARGFSRGKNLTEEVDALFEP